MQCIITEKQSNHTHIMMKQRKGLITHRYSELMKTTNLATCTVGPANDNHQAPTNGLKLKLPNVIELTTKHAVCFNTLML